MSNETISLITLFQSLPALAQATAEELAWLRKFSQCLSSHSVSNPDEAYQEEIQDENYHLEVARDAYETKNRIAEAEELLSILGRIAKLKFTARKMKELAAVADCD